MNVDTAPRTLLVATGIALFCSAMVSLAIYYLRPLQVGMQSLERNRAILEAANLLAPANASDRDVASKFLELDARIVDLDTGWFAGGFDAHAYDHWQMREKADPNDAEPGRRERYVPVYLVRKTDRVAQIILPVDGPGMWSTIYGYIALSEDLNTIAGVTFHRHTETPGVGDRVQDPSWLATWRGKRIRDEDDTLRFRATKEASGPYEVDLVSGASVTTEAAGEIVRTWLSEDHFGPFLRNLDKNQP
jgi:Na+-transporting NADH:ubiquinone oxidoreductase subunit C